MAVCLMCLLGNADSLSCANVEGDFVMDARLARELLIRNGLSEEEIRGLDVIRFVRDYEIDKREYGADELREIIAEEGEYYIDDDSTRIFSILEEKGTADLSEDAVIRAMAYSYNNGTYYERGVIDLQEGYVCVNTAEKSGLSDEKRDALAHVVRDYEVFLWDHDVRGEEPETTGSLAWKIVFLVEDGGYCVYEGFTSDGSHLPDHFNEVMDLLRSAGR